MTLQPSLYQAEQTKWPQPLLMSLAPETFHYLGCPLDTLKYLMSCLYWGTQYCTQYLRWGHTSAVCSGTITSLDWLAMLCLMHPGHGWPFWQTGHTIVSYSICHQSKLLHLFPWGCSSASHLLVCMYNWITPSQVQNLVLAFFRFHTVDDIQMSL